MKKQWLQILFVAGLSMGVLSHTGCGDGAPLSSIEKSEEGTQGAAKLTISGGKAGGSRYRPASTGSLTGETTTGGLTATSERVRGKPDRVARFNLAVAAVDLDGIVTISGSVSPIDQGKPIARVAWEWGDGSSEEGELPIVHEFADAGTWAVTVIATNTQGESQRTTVNVTVPRMFADANLEAAVREAIDQPTGKIVPADVAELTDLSAPNKGIASIEGAQHFTGMFTINLDGNPLGDLTPLAGLPTLEWINCSQCQLASEDLAAVASVPNLRGFFANDNQISDISALAGKTTLEQMSLGSNGLGNDAVAVAGGLTNLVYLQMIFNQISDISPVANLTSLDRLEIQGNPLSDISALAGLTSLTGVRLDTSPLSDISALAGLTGLREVELDNSPLSDIAVLENLPELSLVFLHNTQVTDLTPLVNNAGIGAGDRILLAGNALSAEAISTQIPALEARGVTVDLVSFE